ncbi:acetylxylan esterase [Chloroflexota bacterium]
MPLEELREYQGVNPRPDDFDRFWEQGLAEIRAVDSAVELRAASFQALQGDCYPLGDCDHPVGRDQRCVGGLDDRISRAGLAGDIHHLVQRQRLRIGTRQHVDLAAHHRGDAFLDGTEGIYAPRQGRIVDVHVVLACPIVIHPHLVHGLVGAAVTSGPPGPCDASLVGGCAARPGRDGIQGGAARQ